jgi:Isochorismatase family
MIPGRTMMVPFHDDPPILVCADLQSEYLTEGRSHVITDAEAIMSRCLELMTLWRGNLWPVVHLKRIAQAAWFNPASNLTNWIAEMKPRPGELAFEHPLPSAYSSTRFAEYMSNIRSIRCVLLGFSLDETILATRWHAVAPAWATPLATSSPSSRRSAISPVLRPAPN